MSVHGIYAKLSKTNLLFSLLCVSLSQKKVALIHSKENSIDSFIHLFCPATKNTLLSLKTWEGVDIKIDRG